MQYSFSFPKSLREKCPNTEFFLVRIFLYSDLIQENTDHKNSVFGNFWRSESFIEKILFYKLSVKIYQNAGCFGYQYLWKKCTNMEIFTSKKQSHQRCSIRKAVLRNFAKIHRKHLPESFFNKVAGLRPQACNFIKKETLTQVFSCGFCEISKVVFFLRVPNCHFRV